VAYLAGVLADDMPVCRAWSVIRGTNQNSGKGWRSIDCRFPLRPAVLDGLTTTKRAMLVRETLVIHSRLSWRKERGEAAIKRRHGLQALAIEQLTARLAGGFLQPVDSDALKEAIGRYRHRLGEFNEIKKLFQAFHERRRQRSRSLGRASNSLN